MVLTEKRKVRSTVTNKFDKWLSHCLAKRRMWRNDVGEREYGKQHSCEQTAQVNLITVEKYAVARMETSISVTLNDHSQVKAHPLTDSANLQRL
jgi:hypothetical protein